MFYLTTDASPVSGLQCQGPNTEDATLLMSWVRPSGQYSAFQVILNHTESINFTSTCCSHNVSDLRHYTCYKLTVKTQSCGRPSTAVSQKCWTGITSRTLNIPDDIFLIQVCIISCFVSLFFFFFSSKIHRLFRTISHWWLRRHTTDSPSRLILVCWTTPTGLSHILVCWWRINPLVGPLHHHHHNLFQL